MDKKELYLYGAILSLAEEQSISIAKLSRGELGWWKKSRIEPRGREISKFLQKIIEHKQLKGSIDCSQEISTDLQEIKLGNFPKNYSDGCFETLGNYIKFIL